MADLADRISRGAVAALDLAPFDDRFSRLSRKVLAGGASRFGRVVAEDEPVQFVIPVGLPHDRIDYGALVLQSTRVGVVWRDAEGIDRHRSVAIDPSDPAQFSALTLGGEQWMRFDVPDAAGALTFLIPPVSSPLLRTTLIQVLHAHPGAPAASAGAVPEPDPEPAPFTIPSAAPAPADAGAGAMAATGAVLAGEPTEVIDVPSGDSPSSAPDEGSEWAPDDEEADDEEADAAEGPDEPAAEPEPAPQLVGERFAEEPPPDPDDDEATRVHPIVDHVEPEPTDDLEATRVHPVESSLPQEAAADAHSPAEPAGDDLYRSVDREAPTEVLPSAVREPVAAAPAYAPVDVPPSEYPAARTSPGMSLTVRGFLIGFACALFGGGLALAIRLLAG